MKRFIISLCVLNMFTVNSYAYELVDDVPNYDISADGKIKDTIPNNDNITIESQPNNNEVNNNPTDTTTTTNTGQQSSNNQAQNNQAQNKVNISDFNLAKLRVYNNYYLNSKPTLTFLNQLLNKPNTQIVNYKDMNILVALDKTPVTEFYFESMPITNNFNPKEYINANRKNLKPQHQLFTMLYTYNKYQDYINVLVNAKGVDEAQKGYNEYKQATHDIQAPDILLKDKEIVNKYPTILNSNSDIYEKLILQTVRDYINISGKRMNELDVNKLSKQSEENKNEPPIIVLDPVTQLPMNPQPTVVNKDTVTLDGDTREYFDRYVSTVNTFNQQVLEDNLKKTFGKPIVYNKVGIKSIDLLNYISLSHSIKLMDCYNNTKDCDILMAINKALNLNNIINKIDI